MKNYCLALISAVCLVACSDVPVADNATQEVANAASQQPQLAGRWIMEADGKVMADPQTSGLIAWRDKLVTLSDGSALPEQRRRLHILDPNTAQLDVRPDAMTMSTRVRRSCFAQYLSDEPDLEALVVDPADDSVFYVVTEDASRTGALSGRCQQRFEQTGSTDYPSLLVRVKRQDNGHASMTHVRPLQFPHELNVGDFPNDGIEGMALTPDRTLYLGLEKDAAGQPRIFTLKIDEAFWQEQGFATVADSALDVPTFDSGNHPINGMTWYQEPTTEQLFLLAAARNDDEIWIIDTLGRRATKRIALSFTAPTLGSAPECSEFAAMDNASIEGIAVLGDQLYLINDPWKKHYLKNIACETTKGNYEAMAPLLFSMPMPAEWFVD